MTYTPNTPLGEPSPASQQPQVKTNFSQFASIFSSSSLGVNYNHSAFNTGNQGKHEAIILTQQSVDPVITDDYVDLYCKIAPSKVGNALQIFDLIPQFLPNGIPNTPVQLTCSTVNTAGPQYQSFIAGGYLIYFGTISGNASTTADIVTIITLSPAPTKILTVIPASNTTSTAGTIVPLGVGAFISTTNTSQFTITYQSPWVSGGAKAYSLTWLAIAQS